MRFVDIPMDRLLKVSELARTAINCMLWAHDGADEYEEDESQSGADWFIDNLYENLEMTLPFRDLFSLDLQLLFASTNSNFIQVFNRPYEPAPSIHVAVIWEGQRLARFLASMGTDHRIRRPSHEEAERRSSYEDVVDLNGLIRKFRQVASPVDALFNAEAMRSQELGRALRVIEELSRTTSGGYVTRLVDAGADREVSGPISDAGNVASKDDATEPSMVIEGFGTISVDIYAGTVTVDATKHRLEGDQLMVMYELVRAGGEYWSAHPNGVRIGRVRKSLKEFRDLIESAPGKGTRLRRKIK